MRFGCHLPADRRQTMTSFSVSPSFPHAARFAGPLCRAIETRPRLPESSHEIIKVYLQEGKDDLDNLHGSWPWSNRRMAAAIDYMGYDVRFDWAEGYGHNPEFGGARFPEAMKWLWREERHRPEIDTSDDLRGDLTLLRLLIPGEGWEVVADGLGFADAPCGDEQGNLYFSDMKASAVYRVDPESGATTKIADVAVSGLMFGLGGRLYGCQGAKRRVIAIDPDSGRVDEVARSLMPLQGDVSTGHPRTQGDAIAGCRRQFACPGLICGAASRRERDAQSHTSRFSNSISDTN